jgi:hypothetical protein
MQDAKFNEEDFHEVIRESARLQIGMMVYYPHQQTWLGQRHIINIWIRNRAPYWKISWDVGNLDLSILVAYKLKKNWVANIRLITVVDNEEQKVQADSFMAELIDQARLPKTEIVVHVGNFHDFVTHAPSSDLNIFGLEPDPDFKFMESMVEKTHTTCLFIRDSGLENILA